MDAPTSTTAASHTIQAPRKIPAAMPADAAVPSQRARRSRRRFTPRARPQIATPRATARRGRRIRSLIRNPAPIALTNARAPGAPARQSGAAFLRGPLRGLHGRKDPVPWYRVKVGEAYGGSASYLGERPSRVRLSEASTHPPLTLECTPGSILP